MAAGGVITLILFVLVFIFVVGMILSILRRITGGGSRSYKAIAAWLREKRGVRFQKGTSKDMIRMQLLSILDSEKSRLKAEHDKQMMTPPDKKPKRRRKEFNAESRVAGFKKFIDKQDYAILMQ